MGLSLTTFTDATTMSASDIRDRIETIEQYVNNGIEAGDLKTSARWLNYTHIFKPEFFGSPSPRAEMVSGDTWYRFTGLGRENYAIYHGDMVVNEYISIPGLSATVRNPTASSIEALVIAQFHAFTIAGSASSAGTPFTDLTATFKLYNDETAVTGSRRRLYALPASGSYANGIIGRGTISMVGKLTLTSGTHNVSVRVSLSDPPIDVTTPRWKHTYISARSLVVDAPHLAT